MFQTIRQRIGIPYVALILITMLGLGVYLSIALRQYYLDNLKNHLVAQTRLVGDSLGQALQRENSQESVNVLAHHWADLIDARVTIIASDGLVIGESHEDHALMENHKDRPEISQAFTQGQGSSNRFSRFPGETTARHFDCCTGGYRIPPRGPA